MDANDPTTWWQVLAVMKWPLVACLILPPLLVYFGLHIIRRGVIFVDLALAQVATLGACVAILFQFDPHDWQSYAFSFAFTLIGAAIFTLTRTKEHHQVPQEALIGIVYVVAAAGGILLLNNSPHGNEELKQTLVGELLYLQTPAQVLLPFALFMAIGVVHFIFRKKFLTISFEPALARKEKLSIRGWDFLFYALFGIVVTTFVHIGGVLLVFSYLIIPAVCANLLARGLIPLLAIGCGISTLGSVLGVYCSGAFNWPVGAAIVCVLGVVLLGVAVVASLRRINPDPHD
ncbi:MAG: metal ABC transporter permease [Pedosphaera sp.]|nr:metal ABC transporter permease [Pedosphaera sp.]